MSHKEKSDSLGLSSQEKFQSLFFKNCHSLFGAAPMLPKYIGEHEKLGVKYFSVSERQGAKIKLVDGLFYDNKNQLVSTINPQEVGRYATSSLYVIDLEFNFYIVANKFQDGLCIHHSSVLAGRPVICAGYVSIVNGKLTSLSNESGHYTPTDGDLFKVIHYLKKQQVLWRQYEIRYESKSSLRPVIYKDALSFIKKHPYDETSKASRSDAESRSPR